MWIVRFAVVLLKWFKCDVTLTARLQISGSPHGLPNKPPLQHYHLEVRMYPQVFFI
ncbi:unnamed protein product [Brugia timori]|uniref:Secreted protein n=1 Tax=Brugia timori TaxID=42155 RepID=A0A0R3R416_9BILA|nr:unnamed protein product [Brugia timori]